MNKQVVVDVDEDLIDLAPGYLSKRKVELNQAVDMIDHLRFEEPCRIGHTIKGNAAVFGLAPLGVDGGLLEEFCNHRDQAGARNVLQRMIEYVNSVKFSFESEL